MRKNLLTVGATIATLAMLDVAPAKAQRVSADIHIGGWPVSGTIHVGDRHDRWDRRRAHARSARFVRRDFPRRIVVERFPGRSFRRDFRRAVVVTAYYDEHCGLFFDRPFRGLREVRLHHRNGRYYPMDGRYDRYGDRFDRERDRDDRNRRYPDRGRGDDDYGHWEHEH